MQKIIETIFTAHGFQILSLDNFTLCVPPSDSNKKAYWAIVSLSHPSLLTKTQSKIADSCIKQIAQPDANKNISILSLWNTTQTKLNSTQIKAIIMEQEEDPYIAKKYVLQYTDTEHQEFVQKYTQSPSYDAILSTIMNQSVFAQYKTNPQNGLTSLLYRVAIKLPFISLGKKASTPVQPLATAINNRIAQMPDDSISNLYKSIQTVMGENIDIKSIDSQSILEHLTGIKTND